MKNKIIITSSIFLTGFMGVKAQIDSETVDVEKSYNPSISDASLLEENPKFDNEVEENKIQINYTPINTPVQSDYKVATINPVKLPAQDAAPLFNSFVKGGIGLPESTLLDAYIDYEYDTDRHFGAFFHHFYTTGDIDGAKVDDNMSQNHLELFYKANYDLFSAKVTAGYDISSYNYYGLGNLDAVFGTTLSNQVYQSLNPTNKYHTAYATLGLDSYDNYVFDYANVTLRRFKGDFDAVENYLNTTIKLVYDEDAVLSNSIGIGFEAPVNVEYMSDNFSDAVFTSQDKYAYFKIGTAPQIKFSQDDNYIKVGVSAIYNKDFKGSYSDTHLYPMAELLFKPTDILQIFAGVNGGLKLNTYYDWVQNNPWMAPGFSLLPSNTKYHLYAGLKGVVNELFQYKTELSYDRTDDFAMIQNVGIQQISPIPTFRLENSFGLVYDNVKTYALKSEVNYVGFEHLTASAGLNIYKYTLGTQAHAWNLPKIAASFSADYKLFDDTLVLGTDIYYVGKRKDINYDYTTLTAIPAGYVELNDYIDLNLKGTYYVNDRISIFGKLNNLFGDYEKFKNYQTQNQQFMVGATYKFNVN